MVAIAMFNDRFFLQPATPPSSCFRKHVIYIHILFAFMILSGFNLLFLSPIFLSSLSQFQSVHQIKIDKILFVEIEINSIIIFVHHWRKSRE